MLSKMSSESLDDVLMRQKYKFIVALLKQPVGFCGGQVVFFFASSFPLFFNIIINITCHLVRTDLSVYDNRLSISTRSTIPNHVS
jgi:hypothetical protein